MHFMKIYKLCNNAIVPLCNDAIDYHDDNKSFMRNVRSVQDSTENSLIRIFLWDKNVSFQNKVHDKDYTEYIKRAG